MYQALLWALEIELNTKVRAADPHQAFVLVCGMVTNRGDVGVYCVKWCRGGKQSSQESQGIGGGGVHVISAHKHLWSYFSYIFRRVRWGL